MSRVICRSEQSYVLCRSEIGGLKCRADGAGLSTSVFGGPDLARRGPRRLMGGLILSCREACVVSAKPMQQFGSVFENCCRLGLSPLAQACLNEALGLAVIRW